MKIELVAFVICGVLALCAFFTSIAVVSHVTKDDKTLRKGWWLFALGGIGSVIAVCFIFVNPDFAFLSNRLISILLLLGMILIHTFVMYKADK